MSLKSKIANRIGTALLLCAIHPINLAAHIPIPPKQPGEIGRRVVNTAVADFTLVDQHGSPFRFQSKRGNLVLATFIFTACPDVCPLFTTKFAAIQRVLKEKRFKDYWLLSITTDPEVDNATALREYALRFKADLTHWSFLTGSREDLAKTWKIFGVNVTKTQGGQVFHTALTTLIDRHGNRRVDYFGDKWLDKEVLKDIQWLGSSR
jgi:protein SCO1/2